MKQSEKKMPFWKRVGACILEVLGELLVALISFGVGVGAMALLGNWDAAETIDAELLILLGMIIVFGLLLALCSIIVLMRKRRKNKRPPA